MLLVVVPCRCVAHPVCTPACLQSWGALFGWCQIAVDIAVAAATHKRAWGRCCWPGVLQVPCSSITDWQEACALPVAQSLCCRLPPANCALPHTHTAPAAMCYASCASCARLSGLVQPCPAFGGQQVSRKRWFAGIRSVIWSMWCFGVCQHTATHVSLPAQHCCSLLACGTQFACTIRRPVCCPTRQHNACLGVCVSLGSFAEPYTAVYRPGVMLLWQQCGLAVLRGLAMLLTWWCVCGVQGGGVMMLML